jgi:hypothetical protein
MIFIRNYDQQKGKYRVVESSSKSQCRSAGVMEYWSIEKRHQTISHYANTQLLQAAKPIQVEYAHDRLPSFGS